MDKPYLINIETPIGNFVVTSDGQKITKAYFSEENLPENKCVLLSEAEKQIREYFLGERKEFILPIYINGTDFQKRIYEKLLGIKYGEVLTYKQLGNEVKCKSGRAVGNACASNKIALIIPCHRIVSAKSLGGYAFGVERKEVLLRLEGVKKHPYI